MEFSLPGIPLTNQNALSMLKSEGVIVGIGPQALTQEPEMRYEAAAKLRFDAGWVSLLVLIPSCHPCEAHNRLNFRLWLSRMEELRSRKLLIWRHRI